MWLSGDEQDRDGVAHHIALVIAEQGLGRAVERQDPAGLVQDDDAVGCRVEDGFEFVDAALPTREIRFRRLAGAARRPPPASGRTSRSSASTPSHSTAADLQLDRQRIVLPGRQGRPIASRKRGGSEQARQTAGRGEVFAIVVAGKRRGAPGWQRPHARPDGQEPAWEADARSASPSIGNRLSAVVVSDFRKVCRRRAVGHVPGRDLGGCEFVGRAFFGRFSAPPPRQRRFPRPAQRRPREPARGRGTAPLFREAAGVRWS